MGDVGGFARWRGLRRPTASRLSESDGYNDASFYFVMSALMRQEMGIRELTRDGSVLDGRSLIRV